MKIILKNNRNHIFKYILEFGDGVFHLQELKFVPELRKHLTLFFLINI